MAICHCGREWVSLVQAHCSVCHEHFSTVDNFDRHVPSYKGCKDPAKIKKRSGEPYFKAVESRFGITWAREVQGHPSWSTIPGGNGAHAE